MWLSGLKCPGSKQRTKNTNNRNGVAWTYSAHYLRYCLSRSPPPNLFLFLHADGCVHRFTRAWMELFPFHHHPRFLTSELAPCIHTYMGKGIICLRLGWAFSALLYPSYCSLSEGCVGFVVIIFVHTHTHTHTPQHPVGSNHVVSE